jgi:aryl-alcohol dehydrogenase-like predicted oxidoreductase
VDLRTLGSSDVSVSPVGLGGYELGGGDAARGDPSAAQAMEVVRAALAAGINWLDTSEQYYDTRNETVIGDVLQHVGPAMLVATKLWPAPGGSGFHREGVHAGCRASLKRLRRDRIDIYFLHRPDPNGVPLDETWGAMSELVEQGLVRAIGLSNYTIEQVELCHKQRRVDVVQEGLSLIDYLHHRQPIARCGELGIGVVTFEPIAGGILTGKSLAQVREVWGEEYVAWPFYQRLLVPGKAEQSFAVADGVRPIAARFGISVAQLAIAWVLHQSGVTAALGGTRNPANVRQNAGATDVHLTPDALAELEALIPLGPTMAT